MRLRALVVCPPYLRDGIFPDSVLEEISQAADCPWPVLDPEDWRSAGDALLEADVIVSTWGMPALTEEFLATPPALKAVFYAAGSVKAFASGAGWDRGIRISSARAANGIPVAEYSLAAILLSLNRFWHHSRAMRAGEDGPRALRVPGAYRSKVGLVSLV